MRSPVRLERRLEQPRWLNWAIPVISLITALVLGAILLWLTGKSPLDVYDRILERGFLGPVFKSSTVVRLRHFATVLGLMPSSLLRCASEACDRCIAALTACVVEALP